MSPQPLPVPPPAIVPGSDSRREDRRFFWLAVAYELIVLVSIGLVSALVWNRYYEIMFLPVSILEWGFVGGAVAVLYRVAYPKDERAAPVRFAAWVVAKPIIGMVMGGLVYLLAVSGELFLNGKTSIQNVQFLNVLAFIGGFSDRLSVQLIDRLVDRSQ
jgi:hypothetical protein